MRLKKRDTPELDAYWREIEAISEDVRLAKKLAKGEWKRLGLPDFHALTHWRGKREALEELLFRGVSETNVKRMLAELDEEVL